MKTSERARARKLRADEGRSIREIAEIVGVSQASVSVWVRDIELTPKQRAALRERNPAYNGRHIGPTVRAERARDLRRSAQEAGRTLALRGDAFHSAGCMLYWGEGGKSRNQVRLSNSDPEVVRFFVRFLRTYFDVPNDALRVTCNLFADHAKRQNEIEQFWLNQLGLARSSLCTSTVNRYSKYSKKKRKNRLPYGTCRVTVFRTAIVQHIYGAIQEYAGFERPAWLD